MFMDEKIACGEYYVILRHKANIFKTIFGMELAVDGTLVTPKIFRSDKHKVMNLETNAEMSGILKLVMHITAKVWNMPAHSQRFH